jgi:hypothetical protein
MDTVVAALAGVKNFLAAELLLAANKLDVRMDGGRPPASAGDLFYGIHCESHRPGPIHLTSNLVLDEVVDVGITLTMRSSKIPDDRLQGYYQDSFAPLLRRVLTVMTKKRFTGVLAAMNAMLTNGEDPFVETLFWRGTDATLLYCGPDWFLADPVASDRNTGYRMTVHFGGARRMQTIKDELQ